LLARDHIKVPNIAMAVAGAAEEETTLKTVDHEPGSGAIMSYLL
jgi:hypothetical protein